MKQGHGLQGLLDDTDGKAQPGNASVQSINPRQSVMQDHGLEGLLDDTDGKAQPGNASVQSHNPRQSVMLTPSGYKQTEVEVIPEDWEVSSLGDEVTKVGSGITPTGGEKVYQEEGRPFMRSQNVGWGHLLLDDIAFISEETHGTFPATEIVGGDVLLNITGASIGRSAIADDRIAGGNVNQHVCIIRTDTRRLDGHFLNLFLLSKRGQKQIDSFQAGGNRQGLNFGQIRSFLIPLPPLPEQHAIAAALSDVDALLSGLEQLIAKKRAIKQAIMQQLLTGKVRLTGVSVQRGYKQTEVGEIPEDWDISTAENLCAKIQDGTHFSPRVGGYDHLYITSKNIGYGYLDVSSADRIDAAQHKSIYARCDVRKGDLLLTKDGVNTGNAAINHLDEEFSLLSSVTFLRFIPNSHDAAYFLQYILSGIGQTRIKEMMSGNAITRLTLAKIRKFRFPVPPLVEQTAITTVLSDMDAEIAALEQRCDKTRLLKQGMMQELLTGRIRLV